MKKEIEITSTEESKISSRDIYIKENGRGFTIYNTENRRELIMSFPKNYDKLKAIGKFENKLNNYKLCQ